MTFTVMHRLQPQAFYFKHCAGYEEATTGVLVLIIDHLNNPGELTSKACQRYRGKAVWTCHPLVT